MNEFLARAEQRLPAQEFAPVFEEIAALGRLHSKSNLDLDNIEFVFATFEMAALIVHGSINWARCEDGTIAAWPISDYLATRFLVDVPGLTANTISLTMGSELETYRRWKAKPIEPYIVPPTWTKSSQHKELAHVWRQAATELESAEFIVVIGYSCPTSDAFFRYLFALGTDSLRRIKRFVVIDPSEEAAQRLRDMLGQDAARRFAYHPFVFSGAIAAIKSELGL